MSVTNKREWFDKNNPRVSFRFESDKLHRIITVAYHLMAAAR